MPPSKPTRPGHAPSRGPKHPTAPLRIDRAHACLRGVSRPPMEVDPKVPSNERNRIKLTKPRIAATAIAAAVAVGGAATAFAAGPDQAPETPVTPLTPAANADLGKYKRVYSEAEKYGIAPKRNLARVAPASPDIGERAAVLKVHVVGERGRRKVREELKPEFGTPESLGVSQGTLDSIASCESGGDPTAVDASGTYYGKYQFDTGTWASVGGSGSPAAASEAEQDYRAALLYSRAGSSPWPVCGS
ncbi:MAG: transglycosylase family protein [Thermoleophilales bacterium]|nr:transglycosylase family protein [Thermoleophilales bacterium]